MAADGNSGLLAAVDLQLPWSIRQRCVWHNGDQRPHHTQTGERNRRSGDA
ncbi:MAG: hypothetical protein AB7Y46_04185 [Armatimonadota bacterium]